jgi:glycosyltransferase involved in cell wall biosynthesis/CDP-glycerol glycerophosphotransferase (TagB/SpsB family)
MSFSALTVDCRSHRATRSSLIFVLDINLDVKYSARSIYLLFQSNKEQYVVHPQKIKFIGRARVHIKISRKQLLTFTPKLYGVHLVISTHGRTYKSRIKTTNNKLIAKKSTFISNARRINRYLYSSVFIDSRSRQFCFELRNLKPNERRGEVRRFLAAKVVAGLLRPLIRQEVWLVGENLGEVAQDNGFAFFEYCINNGMPEKVYYVSKADNKNVENLVKYHDRVVQYDSFKHLVLYHLAEYLIVSHGIRDTIPSLLHTRIGKNPKKIIYLQHGIVAMKKISLNGRSYNGKIEKLVVSSDREKDIFVNELNFDPEQIIVTGLARYDRLKDRSGTMETKQILVIPTWRDWLINEPHLFRDSSFYKAYSALLADPRLHTVLEAYNLNLLFFMHIEMQRKFGNPFVSSHERIQVLNLGDRDIRELVEESSLMITDYSSIAFDFNYLNKPVVFFHVDVEDYTFHRGSYIDLRRDLFGDVATTVDALIGFITEYAESGFRYKPESARKSSSFYAYRDASNSERIYRAIRTPRPLRPKVTFLAYNIYGIGGTVRTVTNIANYLASTHRYDVEIISVKKTSRQPMLKIHPGVRLNYLLDARRGSSESRGAKGLIKRVLLSMSSILIDKTEDLYPMFSLFTDIKLILAIRRIKRGVLVTTIPSFNVLSALFARRSVKKIGQEHKTYEVHSKSIKRLIAKYYGKLDVLTCLTDHESEVYREVLGRTAPVYTLENGTAMPGKRSSLTNKVIVSAGRLSYEKGFDILIEAFTKVVERHSDWVLRIYGDGPQEDGLREQIQRNGLQDNVFLMGRTDDMIGALLEASIYVSSSRQESFGMSIIEAMSVGLPCVSFACSGPKEIIRHDVDGLLVDEWDANALAENVKRLIESAELRNFLGTNAFHNVRRYSLESVGSKWESLLRELEGDREKESRAVFASQQSRSSTIGR